jgi:hypothetical protein
MKRIGEVNDYNLTFFFNILEETQIYETKHRVRIGTIT